MDVSRVIDDCADSIWIVALITLLICGIYFLFRMKGYTVTILSPKKSLSWRTDDKEDEVESKKINSIEALLLGIGNHIGVGTIAGIASAIITGGPGALFWMWLFSIIGACVTFMESTLGQIFKNRDSDGGSFGSPAYYALKGLRSRKIAIGMAIIGVLLYSCNMLFQTSNAVDSITTAFNMTGEPLISVCVTLIFTVLTFYAITGGAKTIARISRRVVPIMVFAWIFIALFTILVNWQNLGNSFGMIFKYAFDGSAFEGGLLGTVIVTAMRRAEYSNDSGTGTMAIISAMADVKHPIKLAIMQALGVYFTTILMCTLTGLVILSYGSYDEILALNLNFAPLVQYVISETVFGDWAAIILAVILFVFSYTTIISCFAAGTVNVEFFGRNKSLHRAWVFVAIVFVFIGGVLNTTSAQSIVDIATAFIIVVNLAVIYLLGDRVYEALKDYKRQRAEGIREPVFNKSALSDTTGVTEWD